MKSLLLPFSLLGLVIPAAQAQQGYQIPLGYIQQGYQAQQGIPVGRYCGTVNLAYVGLDVGSAGPRGNIPISLSYFRDGKDTDGRKASDYFRPMDVHTNGRPMDVHTNGRFVGVHEADGTLSIKQGLQGKVFYSQIRYSPRYGGFFSHFETGAKGSPFFGDCRRYRAEIVSTLFGPQVTAQIFGQ